MYERKSDCETAASQTGIYVSTTDFPASDLNGYYGCDSVWAYDFTGHGSNAQAARVVDLLLAVRTPPANTTSKYQKLSGAKATNKLEQLELVRHELNPK